MPNEVTTPVLAWHFLPGDKRLQFGEREPVEVGQTLRTYKGLQLCKSGFHGSVRVLDALQYAPGPVACRVAIGGKLIHGDDKLCGSERTCIAMADATKVLHEFACRCAENALRTAKVEDVQCWAAIETKRKWLNGEATDEELSAAGHAAWDAARAAAWGAAGDAAWGAARAAAVGAARAAAVDAARAAAGAAAGAAAWAAARDAAWAAQNTLLENLLYDAFPELRVESEPCPTK